MLEFTGPAQFRCKGQPVHIQLGFTDISVLGLPFPEGTYERLGRACREEFQTPT